MFFGAASYPPDTFNASAYNDVRNPGLGLDTAALGVTGALGESLDYTYGGNVTVTNISSISGEGNTITSQSMQAFQARDRS